MSPRTQSSVGSMEWAFSNFHFSSLGQREMKLMPGEDYEVQGGLWGPERTMGSREDYEV